MEPNDLGLTGLSYHARTTTHNAVGGTNQHWHDTYVGDVVTIPHVPDLPWQWQSWPTYPSPVPYPVPTPDLTEALKQILDVNTKETQPPMRGLFEVFIVDPETDAVLKTVQVIAADETKAKLKALRKFDSDADLDALDVIVRRIGDVRSKRVVQEVKVVGK